MKRKSSRKSAKTEDEENGVDQPKESGSRDEPKEKKERKSKGKKGKSKHESEESEEEKEVKAESSEETDPLAEGGDDEDDAEYEVQSILDEKVMKGVHHFLIRWKGYTEESDTWEPEHTLDCADLIKDFKEKNKKSKGGKKKSGKEKTEKKEPKEEPKEEIWDENEDFEVDRIIDVYFHKDGKRDFLVSWKGYPASQNTWEPEDNMDCKDLIKKFMAKVEEARKVESVDTKLRVIRKQVNRLAYSMHENDRKLSRRHRGKERVRYFDAE